MAGTITQKRQRQAPVANTGNGLCCVEPHHRFCVTAASCVFGSLNVVCSVLKQLHRLCVPANSPVFCFHSVPCFLPRQSSSFCVTATSQVFCSHSVTSSLFDELCFPILLRTQCLEHRTFQRSARLDPLLPPATAIDHVPQIMGIWLDSVIWHVIIRETTTGGILSQRQPSAPSTAC